MSQSKQQLAELAMVLVAIEVESKFETSALTYTSDVVDDAEYAKNLSTADERRRQAEFGRKEIQYQVGLTEAECMAAAVRMHRERALYMETVLKARAYLRPMAQQADAETRSGLRKMVAEHKSSADSLVVAYLTLKSVIEWKRAYEAPLPSEEDALRVDEKVIRRGGEVLRYTEGVEEDGYDGTDPKEALVGFYPKEVPTYACVA